MSKELYSFELNMLKKYFKTLKQGIFFLIVAYVTVIFKTFNGLVFDIEPTILNVFIVTLITCILPLGGSILYYNHTLKIVITENDVTLFKNSKLKKQIPISSIQKYGYKGSKSMPVFFIRGEMNQEITLRARYANNQTNKVIKILKTKIEDKYIKQIG